VARAFPLAESCAETFGVAQGPKCMRQTHRDVLFDAPAGFDDPLEMLLGCHRRIEKQLDTLVRLREHLHGKSVDAQASIAARNVLRYFEGAAPNHHADEEQDLFPLLAARIDDAAEHQRFDAFRERIESDHRSVEAAWAKLRRPLEAIAEGLARALPEADVQAFVAAYNGHIALEEAAMREFFDRWLGDADRRTLGHAMAARRNVE
jgi:hemerythrin-like domain-containing protein